MKFWIRSRTAVAVAALLSSVAAAPGANAETLPDALAKAYVYSPTLAARRSGLKAADESVRIERAPGLGTITGDYSASVTDFDSSTYGTRDTTDDVELGISGGIPLYDGGRIENSVRSAQENVNAVSAGLQSLEQEVLLDAVTAYEDVRRDIQRVALARNNVRVISEQLRAARDRFEVGEVTRTDVSQAEARLASSRSSLAAAVGALARSRESYIAAVGEPGRGTWRRRPRFPNCRRRSRRPRR